MPSTTDEIQERGFFGLFKGESGAGKSVAALSFPNIYVMDHDEKMPAIAQKHFPGKQISWDTFKDVFEIGDKLVEFQNNGCPYETLVCDSLTSLSYKILKSIDDAKGQNILSTLANIRTSKRGAPTLEIRGFDSYNGEDNFLKYYIDSLKTLWARPGNPKHIILIAHVLSSDSKDMKTGLTTTTRRIVTAGAKIAAYIPAQVDNAFHFTVGMPDIGKENDPIKRICKTEAIGDDFAKTAYNLPGTIDFTGKNFYDIINREIGFDRIKAQLV